MRCAKTILIPVLLLVSFGLLIAFCTGIFTPRWWRFQISGEVPKDANHPYDWAVAQYTTWWGKRLDSKNFWAGRTVWLDASALDAARRHGREYPPLPFEDSTLPAYPNDEKLYGGGLDDPLRLVSSSKESAFWGKFQRTHPLPPEVIEREQQTTVVDYFSNLSAKLKQTIRNYPLKLNYPQEAFTDDALYWAYVYKSRQYYEKYRFLPSLLAVDSKLITEPLTDGQIKTAIAWKLAYLQRLRRENTDEQYIQAYLKAWNLTESEVFGGEESK